MSNWFTRKQPLGFAGWALVWLLVFGGPVITKFFVFDGHSLPDDWRALTYSLVVLAVFVPVSGLLMSRLEKRHFASRTSKDAEES